MLNFNLILVGFLTFLSQPIFALDSNELLPPEQAFRFSAEAEAEAEDRILLKWDIAEGYYLYRNKFKVESNTVGKPIVTIDFPAGKIKHDELFGDVEVYRNHLQATLQLKQTKEPGNQVRLTVQYQGCADIGICYPPQKTTLNIDLPRPVTDQPADPVIQSNPIFKALKLNLFEDELLPPEQAFQFFTHVKDSHTLNVNWQIADDYYLYREKIQLEILGNENVRIVAFDIPRGTPKHDEAFGQVEIFRKTIDFDVPLIRTDNNPQNFTLKAKFQGCADRGVCYPPMTETLEVQLPAPPSNAPIAQTPPETPISEQDRIVRSLQQDTLWLTLLSFFGFGLLLSFTPCVFPMIPILSGIIVGQGKNITSTHAFLLSFSYVLASAITYTAFGILAALFGSNLQTTFQQPWIIGLFSALFVLLSLSMFGFYNLELPKSFQSKLHDSSEKHRNGSMWGAAIMGSLSSLIVGPCVAAPLAGALIYIGQTGDALLGGSALFTMGFGMGVPLLLLGASAGKLLPKAGNWLNSTKAVFGVIMLAVAVWMLERILPATIIMFLWALLLIIPAIYLSAIDPLPENATGWRKLWKGTGVIMLVYGVLLLIGLGIGNNNPMKPLQGVGITPATASAQKIMFTRIKSLADLNEAIEQASADHKIVMLDYYADWCISCKEMEAYTFSDPEVQKHLSELVLLQADVTLNTPEDQALLKQFNLIGPPAILFFGTDRQEKKALRVIGYQDAATFISTLQHTQL